MNLIILSIALICFGHFIAKTIQSFEHTPIAKPTHVRIHQTLMVTLFENTQDLLILSLALAILTFL